MLTLHECGRDYALQGLNVERLHEIVKDALLQGRARDRFILISADDDDRDGRVQLPKAFKSHVSGHVRHVKIQENDIRAVERRQHERVAAGQCRFDSEAGMDQGIAEESATVVSSSTTRIRPRGIDHSEVRRP